MRILKNLNYDNIIFIDIETATVVENLEKGTPLYASWEYKQRNSRDKEVLPRPLEESFKSDGALFPEFAKIICISIGKVINNKINLKSYYNTDEKILLTEFTKILSLITEKNPKTVLSGWAIFGFDLPFIVKRCFVNQIQIPNLLDISHLKPWEISSLDLMNIWKGTGFNGASLINACVALDIPSPKEDIFGFETTKVFYSKEEGSLERIAKYCERDVVASANIFKRLRYENLLEVDKGEIKTKELPILEKLFNGAKYDVKEAKILTNEYQVLPDEEKAAMVLILQSLITKDTSFKQEHLDAIVNYKPKKLKDVK